MKLKIKAEKCQRCEKVPGTKNLHSCPYQIEIFDNEDVNCNCCNDCENECAADI